MINLFKLRDLVYLLPVNALKEESFMNITLYFIFNVFLFLTLAVAEDGGSAPVRHSDDTSSDTSLIQRDSLSTSAAAPFVPSSEGLSSYHHAETAYIAPPRPPRGRKETPDEYRARKEREEREREYRESKARERREIKEELERERRQEFERLEREKREKEEEKSRRAWDAYEAKRDAYFARHGGEEG